MNLEIEKKYLITDPIKLDLTKYKKLKIFQAYLNPSKIYLNTSKNTLDLYFEEATSTPISLNIQNTLNYVKLTGISNWVATDLTIRVRQLKSDYQHLHFLTIKTNSKNSGLVRNEYEISIDQEEFNLLKNRSNNAYIKKSRYIIPIENDLNIELDVFEDNLEGLILAEVEFNNVEQANNFILPHFADAHDVTHILDFNNKFLVNVRRDELWKLINQVLKE